MCIGNEDTGQWNEHYTKQAISLMNITERIVLHRLFQRCTGRWTFTARHTADLKDSSRLGSVVTADDTHGTGKVTQSTASKLGTR